MQWYRRLLFLFLVPLNVFFLFLTSSLPCQAGDIHRPPLPFSILGFDFHLCSADLPYLVFSCLLVWLICLFVCLFFNFFLPSHSLSTHERGLFDYTMAWYHLRRTHFISFLFVLNQKALCVFTPSVFIDNDIKSIHSREKP